MTAKKTATRILAFQGSRVLDGENITDIIRKEILKHRPEYIVTSGEASGVCALAREYCQRNGLPVKLHFLAKKYAQGKYHHRSMGVLTECDFCIFIHDGISKGTKNELALAKKLKKPYTYYKVKDKSADMAFDKISLNLDI